MCTVSLHKQHLVNVQMYIVIIFQLDPPIKLLRKLAICRQAFGALRVKRVRIFLVLLGHTKGTQMTEQMKYKQMT